MAQVSERVCIQGLYSKIILIIIDLLFLLSDMEKVYSSDPYPRVRTLMSLFLPHTITCQTQVYDWFVIKGCLIDR